MVDGRIITTTAGCHHPNKGIQRTRVTNVERGYLAQRHARRIRKYEACPPVVWSLGGR
jgi:hypothetical protein